MTRYQRTPPHADDEASPARPVIWTVSVSRLSRLLGEVTPEFDAQATIESIPLGFGRAVDAIRERLQHERCDVIVAAGSNGAYLKNRVGRPVVLVRATGFDVMQALTRAQRVGPRIGMVTQATDVPGFDEFQQAFGLAIEHRRAVTVEDARAAVAELVARGAQVIVGSGMATEFAERAGIPGILLYSAASVREAFEQAIELARMMALTGTGGNTDAQPRRRPALVPADGDVANRLLGDSAPMRAVREQIALYARHPATVLVQGETGTGKERVARAIHAASGRRGAFVAVNCAAIAESLLEAELFGHGEGAFTGARRGGRAGLIEAADHGTLLLDEIGEMPLPLQTRLLRVLEEREVLRVGTTRPVAVDLRVVAATHGDLLALIEQGRFRRDLYYRLAVLRITVPRLAERPDDIATLAAAFLTSDPRGGTGALMLDADAQAVLANHAWPGNVRELRNVMERVAIHAITARAVDVETADSVVKAPPTITALQLLHWAPELSGLKPIGAASAATPEVGDPPRPNRAQLDQLMLAVNGNRAKAAARLGVSRTTLWRWLRGHPR